MNRLLIWMEGFIKKQQCCYASTRIKTKEGCSTFFCIKFKGHFGKHKTGE